MPYTTIWIHLVFSTKNREPFLISSIRQKVFQHILENARSKGIVMSCVNGYSDHAHVLVRLLPTQQLSKVVQLIKGESSFWINSNKLIARNFEWQREYFAVSVGKSDFERVFNYIQNQEKHHSGKSFAKEYNSLLKKYDLQNTDEVD
jgi:REP element-mobilizing transposase RayT